MAPPEGRARHLGTGRRRQRLTVPGLRFAYGRALQGFREAIDLLLGTGDAAVIDNAIVDGYARARAPALEPKRFSAAVTARP
jgi:hypothetical protein